MIEIKNKITDLLAEAAPELSREEIFSLLETPADPTLGDCAFPCFRLSKARKTAPPAIAQSLKASLEGKLSGSGVSKIDSAGGYLNFFFDRSELAESVIERVINEGTCYGSSAAGAGRTIVIDYSSPNIAKPFHIGLLYGTLIGSSLYKIFNFLGYKSYGINYLGDWGTQFGKLIVAYNLWSSEEAVKKDKINELLRVYVKYHAEAEEKPELGLDNEARAWLVKMQDGDETALSLWKWFREITLDECNRMYERLGIKFDSFNGESFYNDKMDAVVDELQQKNLLEESDGAMIVRLDEYKMPPCLILRGDGGTLYPTRDIASGLYRKKEYNFHKAIYITDARQALHFAQWFKVIGLMGYDWEKDLIHVPYGYLSLKGGAMSTRKGNFVLVDDLLNEAASIAETIIEEKNPNHPAKKQVAEQVALGAIIFSDLYNSRIKDVVFDMEKILSFEGETGPYVQYTHARACSVLEKGREFIAEQAGKTPDYSLLSDSDSVELIKLLAGFNDTVADAAEKLEPYIISRYVMSVAQTFNKFYHNNPILTAEPALRAARLKAVSAARTVIANALTLLGIAAPERM